MATLTFQLATVQSNLTTDTLHNTRCQGHEHAGEPQSGTRSACCPGHGDFSGSDRSRSGRRQESAGWAAEWPAGCSLPKQPSICGSGSSFRGCHIHNFPRMGTVPRPRRAASGSGNSANGKSTLATVANTTQQQATDSHGIAARSCPDPKTAIAATGPDASPARHRSAEHQRFQSIGDAFLLE